jgi:hypothetical protein
MESPWLHALEQWHEFFLLCGTAAVTLTGALFVVISLGPSIIASQNATGVKAFISPNALHFTVVLVVSHALLASAIPPDATGWLLCVGGLLSLLHLWSTRAPRQWRENGLSAMDFIWYIILPNLAYALVLAEGVAVLRDDARAVSAIAATMVFMLVIGIRNAWDLAVWMPQQEKLPPEQRVPGAGDKAADSPARGQSSG